MKQPIIFALVLSFAPLLLAAKGPPHPKFKRNQADDPFSQNVRTTEPLSPEQERQTFHLPEGFEIQLVASEPDINKPMNIAFDDKGRLWVTTSREYPFAAPENKGRDQIKILEDFDENGKARKITTFAGHLNIPIGIYPYRDGALAYSIPWISNYRDTDGDGKADEITPYYGPFSFDRDTHGMSSNYKRGFDGWLYGCHGFNNISTVHGLDGQSFTMNSGNTYRMRLDGSHIEPWTWGQTNPFGLCFDPLGNLYSSDSHSKPIYQLLRGGNYEGINKTNDGLGFAPNMMTHLHGSTAIASIVYYAAEQFPKDFRNNVFVGNVVTSRINRDALKWHGSSSQAIEQPDFLSTDDPWFRPDNLLMGPDGAMYVADFYNRIIGHYEVPLDHPGRDRERGRIWRIVYKGKDAAPTKWPRTNWTTATTEELVGDLTNSNLAVRTLATDELVDRVGLPAVDAVKGLIGNRDAPAVQRVHAMWILYRLGSLDGTQLEKCAADPDRAVRVHAMRVLAEIENWSDAQRKLSFNGLKDSDPLVARCAADALGRHPDRSNVAPLLELERRIASDDTHLMYVTRMALRDQFKTEGSIAGVGKLSDQDARAIVDVAISLNTAEAATFLIRHIDLLGDDRAKITAALKQGIRFVQAGDIDAVIEMTRKQFADDIDLQLDLVKELQVALAERGEAMTPSGRKWALELARYCLNAQVEDSSDWTNTPIEGASSTANPWGLQQRKSADGDVNSTFLSTLPHESWTGQLRSKPFTIPTSLSFFIAGHNGYPGTNPEPKNKIRLRLVLADKIVAETLPPRNDLAQQVTWDLKKYAGQRGYLEIVDGNEGNAYAWIAVGRLEPGVARIPKASPSLLQARKESAFELAANLKLTELKQAAIDLVSNSAADPELRAQAALAYAAFAPEESVPALVQIYNDPGSHIALRQKVATALGKIDSQAALDCIIAGFRAAPSAMQILLAQSLSQTQAGSEALLSAVADGKAPARLLTEQSIQERLRAQDVKNLDARIKTLTAGITPARERIQQTIDTRRAIYPHTRPSAAAGKAVFQKTCMVCHQIDGQGKVVGPQLDGIGNRGLDRLIEDILDPSRNVDPAFRYSTYILNDGNAITALQRRQEGDVLILIDSTGKEQAIPTKNIKRKIESKSSLMPDNFADAIPLEDFNNLLAYLLSKKAKTK